MTSYETEYAPEVRIHVRRVEPYVGSFVAGRGSIGAVTESTIVATVSANEGYVTIKQYAATDTVFVVRFERGAAEHVANAIHEALARSEQEKST